MTVRNRKSTTEVTFTGNTLYRSGPMLNCSVYFSYFLKHCPKLNTGLLIYQRKHRKWRVSVSAKVSYSGQTLVPSNRPWHWVPPWSARVSPSFSLITVFRVEIQLCLFYQFYFFTLMPGTEKFIFLTSFSPRYNSNFPMCELNSQKKSCPCLRSEQNQWLAIPSPLV